MGGGGEEKGRGIRSECMSVWREVRVECVDGVVREFEVRALVMREFVVGNVPVGHKGSAQLFIYSPCRDISVASTN